MAAPDERFEEIYQQHYAAVFRYLRTLRLDVDDAHDITQDTFKRLYERMDRIPADDSILTFLIVVARNVVLNRIRDAKAKKRESTTESLDWLLNTADISVDVFTGEASRSPENVLIDDETARLRHLQLSEAISSLPAGSRECLTLWLGGYKYEQIARALSISLDAVKSRIRDARRQIRLHLDRSA